MSTKVHILSKFANLTSLLREETANRIKNNSSLKAVLGNLEFVDIRPPNENDSSLASEELAKINGAQILMVDNDILPMILSDSLKREELKSLRWIQNTWAGVDLLHKHNVLHIAQQSGIVITRFSGYHLAHAMADYVLAHIINHERNVFHLYKLTKISKSWATQQDRLVNEFRRTDELSVAVLGGTGAIGSYICKKLSSLGANVLAYGRSARSTTDLSQLSKEYGFSKYSTCLEELLPQVDYIVSVLPSTPQTDNLLNVNTLKLCFEKKPVLINIGRGNLISEKDIIDALEQKYLSFAILDVFQTEPVPADSPLWSRDDVLITPHHSGVTRACDLVHIFLDNYINYAANNPLKYVLNLNDGY